MRNRGWRESLFYQRPLTRLAGRSSGHAAKPASSAAICTRAQGMVARFSVALTAGGMVLIRAFIEITLVSNHLVSVTWAT